MSTNPIPPLPVLRPQRHQAPPKEGLPKRERPRTAWTADQLMAAHFPEPKWAVPGILAEGVSLLAGPPKVGKSWLSLGLGLAVAAGSKAFDAVPVQGGPVLYLALEDTPRRLQTRMGKLLGGQKAPAGLTLVTECPPFPQGGAEAIAGWLDRNPDARMVVIDVFAKMRGQAPQGVSAYDADYHAVGFAKRIADHYGIAVVLVHHVRKAGSEDFLTEVSGTNGIAGAADATLVLKRARGQADGILHVTGRDVNEAEYALQFQDASGAWHLLDGPVSDHTVGDTRAAILKHVRAGRTGDRVTEWSYTVRIWGIRKRPYRKPFQLRWRVGTHPHSESFLTAGLAESRRAQLITASRAGEPFDVTSGLPKSMVQKERDISWYQHARNYVESKWDHSPATTRRNLAEAMATVTLALVKDTKGMADHRTVRRALYSWAFNVKQWDEELPDDVKAILAWVERKSVPTSALSDRLLVRRALDACARRLDGKAAAGTVIARKRAIFHQALGLAVDAELLAENPLPSVRWKAPERVEEEVDPECVPDPAQAAGLLAGVRAQGARAAPGSVLRLHLLRRISPRRDGRTEAAGLRVAPPGLGDAGLRESRARSGTAWTDSGEAHDHRGLKHRSRKAVRYVPIPPELVALLRWHVIRFGTAPDGRLFRTARGGMVQESGYGEVWARARGDVLSPGELATKLAKRPYDLRHAAVSTWLSSGVEPQLVAARAGHSVAVLFRVYAKFLKGGDEAANAKISARLRRFTTALKRSGQSLARRSRSFDTASRGTWRIATARSRPE